MFRRFPQGLGEGPTEAARYRDEKAGYDAYIIRQWLEPSWFWETR